jgi:peroxiredoxin
MMPKVVLTEQHAAMSPVKVGDQFPNLELPDVAGAQRSLTELYGPKLTLVVFWSSAQPTALEELSDMNRYYLPRFAEKGLAVVAVNAGEPAAQAGELAKATGATFVVLSDPNKTAFAQVATGKLPRSYLLDASGRVIWFDLEYSPTTRRDLAVAIRHTLGE